MAPTPYTELQKSFDANLPKGQRYYSKARYLSGLSDEAIEEIVGHVRGMKGEFTAAYLEPGGGAAADVDVSATAFAGRNAPFGFHIIAGWASPDDDDAVMGWTSGFHRAMAPHATSGVYVNLLGEDEADRVAAAYGPNLDKVQALKARWDPNNLFSVNKNVTV